MIWRRMKPKSMRPVCFPGAVVWLWLMAVVLLAGCRPEPESPPTPAPQKTPQSSLPDPKVEGPSDPGPPPEFSVTESGLKYRILRKSKGDKPNEYSSVTVSQKGWLDDGRIFESTYDRGVHVAYSLDKIYVGLREGLPLVGEGGKIELEIPSKLAYGTTGLGSLVPPNATVHYIIELHSFK
jgi:FKBP-type peptidyl-prolyl cis-trans isomerase FkpA